MRKERRKKRAVTLIEIMIVILLIGLIGGALAFNMRGSMDKGKLFKTEQNCNRVYDALMMAYAAGEFELTDINKPNTVKAVLAKSPLIKDPDQVLKDAWGQKLTFELDGDEIKVYSAKANALKQK